MTIENPQLATFLVFVISGLVLFQTALVFAFIWACRTAIQRLDAQVDRVAANIQAVLHLASESLQAVEDASTRLTEAHRVLTEKLKEIVEVGQIGDERAGRELNQLRSQLKKVNGNTDALLSRFTVQTFKVHRAILDPSMRLSAILRAGVAAVRQAFSRGDGPTSHLPDQSDFI